jgi:RNAse (barnase) inhibitor barstar
MTDASWLTTTAAAQLQPGAVTIDGARCRTRAGLFTEWARALRFPGHFGHNWDAFYDSLADRARSGEPLTIVLTHAEQLLADEPEQTATFMDAVGDAATGRLLGEAAGPPALRLVLVRG